MTIFRSEHGRGLPAQLSRLKTRQKRNFWNFCEVICVPERPFKVIEKTEKQTFLTLRANDRFPIILHMLVMSECEGLSSPMRFRVFEHVSENAFKNSALLV